MKLSNKLPFVVILLALFLIKPIFAEGEISDKLAGRILLQVEKNGEAWFVNPADNERYLMGRPDDAFSLMRQLGIGITNDNLNKFPVGVMAYDDNDDDTDGLSNRLEEALGTDPDKPDTDADTYNDKTEVENGFNPNGSGSMPIDNEFIKQHLGKIFLQVESAGEAWYIDPVSEKRFYLGRPSDAFAVMRNFGLGITNDNLNKITLGLMPDPPPPLICTDCTPTKPEFTMAGAGQAIRSNDLEKAKTYFTEDRHKSIEYTLNNFNDEQRLTLGNILSGATLTSSSSVIATFETEVYFSLGGWKVPVEFFVAKQPDDTWLLTGL